MSSIDDALARTVNDILNLSPPISGQCLFGVPATSQPNDEGAILTPMTSPVEHPTPMTSPVEYFSETFLAAGDEHLPRCQNCALDQVAHSKCLNCNEHLCDTCVCAHKQVRETKDHKIKLHGLSQNSNKSEDSGSSGIGPSVAGTLTSTLSQSPSEDSVLTLHSNGGPSLGGDLSSAVVPSCSGLPQNGNSTLSSDVTHLLNSMGLNSITGPFNLSTVSQQARSERPCPIHKDSVLRLYCMSCLIPVCTTCMTFEHGDHHLIVLDEGLEAALQTSAKLNEETRRAMMILRDSLDNIFKMTERVERSAFAASTQVRADVRRCIQAFEAREMCLLRKINQGRELKIGLLNSQMEKIRMVYTRMAKTADHLNEFTKTVGPVSVDLLAANGHALKELRDFKNMGLSLAPSEDDGFHYQPVPESFFHDQVMNNLGRLSITSSTQPSTVSCNLSNSAGSGPPTRFRDLRTHYMASTGSSTIGAEPNITTAKSRPIYGVPNPIIVKDMGPNPSMIFGVEPVNNKNPNNTFNAMNNYAGQINSFNGFGGSANTFGGAVNTFGSVTNNHSNTPKRNGTGNAGAASKSGAGETPPLPLVDGQVNRPWGIAVNRYGHYVVGDRSNHRIQVFDSEGQFLFKFGSHGSAPTQFNLPAGVAINPRDDIVVADKDNHRIQVFKRDGTFDLTFGDYGSKIGQFAYPWDVACDSKGNIVVSDSRNHRIQLFTWNGSFIGKYGFEGNSGPPNMFRYFDQPRGVCFHPSGEIIVSDFNNHRLVIIDATLTKASYMGEKSETGEYGKFFRPQGVTCDDRGNIIVSDSRSSRIQIFNDKGEFLWTVGQAGSRPGELNSPSGICLTIDGRVAVVDFGNNRMQVF